MADQMPKHGTFCWNELVTKDEQAAGKFYSELLGWKLVDSGMEGMKYTLLKAGDKDAGGMMQIQKEWGEVPSHWMSYIAVDDVDALAAKVESLGGKVCVPPTDIPKVGRFCVVTDPTGANVSLMKFSGG